MANRPDAKLKLLMVMRALFEETDADHGITVDQLVEWLAMRGVEGERKSVQRDIETLQEFGLNVVRRRSECVTYRLIDPLLSMNQWEMAVDAVQSSPCLDARKTFEIVDGIGRLVSRFQRERLDRKLATPKRVKMSSEHALENLEIVREALSKRKKIAFRYATRDTDDGLFEHFGGNEHSTTTIEVVYAMGFYYLVAFEERYKDIAYYRLDRMLDASVACDAAVRHEKIANYRADDQGIISFGPYEAEVTTVELCVARRFVGAVVDRFGTDIAIRPDEGDPMDCALVRVKVALTPMFYSWLLGLGESMVVAKPKRVREEFVGYLKRSLALYQGAEEDVLASEEQNA